MGLGLASESWKGRIHRPDITTESFLKVGHVDLFLGTAQTPRRKQHDFQVMPGLCLGIGIIAFGGDRPAMTWLINQRST